MAELNVESRREIYISDKLRPYAVDTKNSLTVVNQLEMVPPSKDMLNPFELRFLNNEHTFAQQQYVRQKKKAEAAQAEQKEQQSSENNATEKIHASETPSNKKPPIALN